MPGLPTFTICRMLTLHCRLRSRFLPCIGRTSWLGMLIMMHLLAIAWRCASCSAKMAKRCGHLVVTTVCGLRWFLMFNVMVISNFVVSVFCPCVPIQVQLMMDECKEAVVQAICVTIAANTVLQFLASLSMKECKKPEKSSVKEPFKHLLESITSCEEPGFSHT